MFKVFNTPNASMLCGSVRPNMTDDTGLACDVVWSGWFPGYVYIEVAEEHDGYESAAQELHNTTQKRAEEIYRLMYLDAQDDDDTDKVVQ